MRKSPYKAENKLPKGRPPKRRRQRGRYTNNPKGRGRLFKDVYPNIFAKSQKS